jgi:hypothetical protein
LITAYHVCIAVSRTADALGAYHLYDYDFGPADQPDYPKLGVWPDAYYLSANIFQDGSFIGARACALDKAAMIGGAAAPAMICFQSSSFHSLLPSGLDGSLPPASGTPNYFLQSNCCTSLALYKFHVDFGAPASSTFTGPVSIPVAKYATSGGGNTVPQLDTTEKLEDFGGGRLMYRNLGAYESLLVSHTRGGGLEGSRRIAGFHLHGDVRKRPGYTGPLASSPGIDPLTGSRFDVGHQKSFPSGVSWLHARPLLPGAPAGRRYRGSRAPCAEFASSHAFTSHFRKGRHAQARDLFRFERAGPATAAACRDRHGADSDWTARPPLAAR